MMVSGMGLFGVILVAVIAMVILISKFKWHPFLVLILSAYFVGMMTGMPADTIIGLIKKGLGGILGNIGIVIICGTIIGVILEKTGAALTMANTILKLVGRDKAPLTMSLTGFVTSIPVFCDSGFVILSPINRALAEKTGTSLAIMATALSSGLYATHCLVPPTPGPIIMADTLRADLGLTILTGLAISIPVMIAGYLYATKFARRYSIDANPDITLDDLLAKYGKLPGAAKSFAPIVIPIILIAFKSIADFPAHPFGEGMIKSFLDFIGNPVTALILGVGAALLLVPERKRGDSFTFTASGISSAASILVITGAGGALGQVLRELPLADVLSASLLQYHIGLLIPFIIALILKTAMGASTVSMIVTSAMIAPLMVKMGFTSEFAKVLTVMAIGAGSMTVSHANDSYFWVVSQFSDMETSVAYKCQTGVTLVQGVTAICIIQLLAAMFV